MVFRDYAQGAFRMRGIGKGQKICLFVIPEIQNLIARELKIAWNGKCNQIVKDAVREVIFLQFSFERRLELGWQKKKSTKKKGTTTTQRRRRRVPQILYLVKLFTFLSKFLPFSPSFNLQKLFLMFSTSTIYPRDILRKQFSQKSFSEKKKNQKKLFIFFFRFFVFDFFFLFSILFF